jgi:FtsZ-binding cell division protein ZapB
MSKNNLNPKAVQLINSISALLGIKASDDEPKAGSIRLADGETIIYFDGDALETGKAVFTDEAMTTPAPEGEHALEDGRLMIVDSAGIVVELREIEASADEQLQEAQARIEALEQENADLKESIEAQKADTTAKLKDAQALVAQLKAQVVSGNSGAKGEHGSNKKPKTASSNVEGGEKFLSTIREKLSRAKEGKL